MQLWSQTYNYDPSDDTDVWAIRMPVDYIAAINGALRAWRYGGKVVFPSRTFNAPATLQAIAQEKCTYIMANSSILRALLNAPEFLTMEPTSLNHISLNTTSNNNEDLYISQFFDGVTVVRAYGIIEGA